MEHDFLFRSCENSGTPEKVVVLFWTNCSKGKFVFHFFKAIFVSGLRGRFLVNGTDLYK